MIEEAFHLASHLPTLVRGIYWENYRPAEKPEVYRSREEFLQKVSDNLKGAPALDAETAARAVLAALDRHVPDGEMKHVTHLIPEDVRALFPQR